MFYTNKYRCLKLEWITKHIAFLGFLFLINSVMAQNLAKDAESMSTFYANAGNIRTQIQINMFEDENQSRPTEIQTTILRKKGLEFYYKLKHTEMLITSDYVLMINNVEKSMLIQKRTAEEAEEQKGAAAKQQKMIPEELTEMLRENDKVIYKGIKGNTKWYEIQSENSAIVRTDLFLNVKDYHISKLIYHYHENAGSSYEKIEISYNGFELNPLFKSNDFSIRPYVRLNNGEFELSEQYRNYHLSTVN